MRTPSMFRLFLDCLTASYRTVEQNADFALKKQGDRLVIYFEKSDGLADWRHNFAFAARPYHEMPTPWKCHRGFLAVWLAAKPYLEEAIADPAVKEILIVGYSHGAALALLCHEYVWFHRPDLRSRLQGYGFGCPRVIFSGLFGRIPPALQERWQNFSVVRNAGDLVTHLPPALFGYRHVGRKVKLGRLGRYSPIGAHRPENYLWELLQKEEEKKP